MEIDEIREGDRIRVVRTYVDETTLTVEGRATQNFSGSWQTNTLIVLAFKHKSPYLQKQEIILLERKIEEPRGIGAVVLTRNNEYYIKINGPGNEYCWVSNNIRNTGHVAWRWVVNKGIVKVLSEGVAE